MTALVPKTPTVIAGVIFAFILTVVGILAPLVAPYDPKGSSILERNIPPGASIKYPLGTDFLGRDMLSRMIYGLRFPVILGGAAVLLGTISNLVLVGLGARSSVFKNTGQLPARGFLNYSLLSLAGLILLIGPFSGFFVLAILGSGLLTGALVVISFAAIPPLSLIYCSVRSKLPLLAIQEWSTSTGEVSPELPVRVACRECRVLLPITYSLAFLTALLLESQLSFLGLGVPPGEPSLGGMIAEGRDRLLTGWWISLLPLGVVSLTGVAFLAIVLPIRRVQKKPDLNIQPGPTVCPQCGSPTGAANNFCIECGTELTR